jgi:hypothetical protein
MSGRSRGQREVVEASTDGEARIIIKSPEDIQDELDRLTFEPRRSSPDLPDVGPDVFAQALQHTAERDEARRQRDEQVALRAEEREAANAAFKAADAERETHLATISEKDREIASLKARLRRASASDENVESEVDDGAPAPAAAEPAVAFTGPDLTDAERHMVEFVLRREPKDVISMKTLRREVEALLGAPEDALKVKKGAIKAFLRTECVPRVLATMPRIVDDED